MHFTNSSVSGVMVSDSVAETVAFEANSLLTLSMENYDFKDRLVFRTVHIINSMTFPGRIKLKVNLLFERNPNFQLTDGNCSF